MYILSALDIDLVLVPILVIWLLVFAQVLLILKKTKKQKTAANIQCCEKVFTDSDPRFFCFVYCVSHSELFQKFRKKTKSKIKQRPPE